MTIRPLLLCAAAAAQTGWLRGRTEKATGGSCHPSDMLGLLQVRRHTQHATHVSAMGAACLPLGRVGWEVHASASKSSGYAWQLLKKSRPTSSSRGTTAVPDTLPERSLAAPRPHMRSVCVDVECLQCEIVAVAGSLLKVLSASVRCKQLMRSCSPPSQEATHLLEKMLWSYKGPPRGTGALKEQGHLTRGVTFQTHLTHTVKGERRSQAGMWQAHKHIHWGYTSLRYPDSWLAAGWHQLSGSPGFPPNKC